MTYEEFVRRDGVRLRAGLVAAYGPDVGADAAAEAARAALAVAPRMARAHACLSRACAQGQAYLGAYGHAVKAEQSGIDRSEVWSLLQGSP